MYVFCAILYIKISYIHVHEYLKLNEREREREWRERERENGVSHEKLRKKENNNFACIQNIFSIY